MREIKFRGKKVDNGEWVYGYLMGKSIIGDFMNHDFVVPETVGQFTGLKDKNGVEIYEGDIVQTHDLKMREFISTQSKLSFEVIHTTSASYNLGLIDLGDWVYKNLKIVNP